EICAGLRGICLIPRSFSQLKESRMTQETIPEPVRDGTGASIMGPHNVPVELENPNLLASPDTDAGTIPNLKFSFSTAHNRLLTGGWSREVTVREPPIATTIV